MPALPVIPNVMRIDLYQVLGSSPSIRNRFFLHYSGSVSLADLGTLVGTIRNSWNTNMAPSLAANHSLNTVEGTDLSSYSGAQAFSGLASPGGSGGTAMSAGVSFIIKFKIARRYRGGHPRFYLAGGVTSWL